MSRYENLEEKVGRTGREIYKLIGDEIPSVFDTGTWKGRIFEWAMKDETFKGQLFRFVDVLPSLESDALVVALLNEYFAHLERAPLIVRQGLRRISRNSLLPHVVAPIVRTGVKTLARQFFAGQDPPDALPSFRKLRRNGFALSVDLLGEQVLSDTEATEYVRRYLELLAFLGPETARWHHDPLLDADDRSPIPRFDISLKVSSLYSQLDPLDWEASLDRTRKELAPVVKAAMLFNASLTLDMEHYYLKDLTIAIFKSLMDEHKDLQFAGIALQAYLKDTKEDLLRIIEWAKESRRRITVRLVKGAYWDYETVVNRQKGWPVPVFLRKEESDYNYEELTKILLENSEHIRPALGTHSIRSISHAIAVAESLGLPRETLEFQMLYGMAEPITKALQRLGFRLRMYTPVGELISGMAYLIRRLLENTSNESFLRKSFYESRSLEQWLQPPAPSTQDEAEGLPSDTFTNEPSVDFSRASNRKAMREALKKARESFGKEYPLIIGQGEVWTDKHIVSVNPARPDEPVGRVASAGIEEAESATGAAREAWDGWRRTPPEERAGCLFRAAKEIRERRFELMALEVYEVGKTWKDADADVTEAVDYLQYYGREMLRLGTPRRLGGYPGEDNEYRYVPRGVGVVISPWNFPLAIPAGMVSAGIVTGNCIIFKPSGLSSVLGYKLSEVFRLSGLPSGVLNFLPGSGGDVGEYLVSHPAVDFIVFTGSKDVGLRIVRLAGETPPAQKNVKRVIAEMGGKNAIIIDETADLDEAVKGVLESAFVYQGQKCSACSRVITIGEVFHRFCKRLKDAAESIRIGPAEEPATFMGPVVDEVAYGKIQEYIEIGRREGRVILAREVRNNGYFIGPAIIAEVDTDSRVAQEEIFGPVLSVMRANDMDEALRMANSTPYALTGGVFSRSPANIEKVIAELRAGNLYVNRKITGALVGRQPFGGFGMSGVGSKSGGPDYLLQFMNPKSISENTLRRGFAPKNAL